MFYQIALPFNQGHKPDRLLGALLTAELIDNASWELLIQIAKESGKSKLTPRFRHALKNEERHEDQVRSWLGSIVLQEVS